MAKFARCEGCGKEEPLVGSMESVPYGWVDATEHFKVEADRDYLACGPDCMAAVMVKRFAEIGAEPKVKTA
jgi:hypothetical protein